MDCSFTHKVAGGKLLKVKVALEGGVIKTVRIHGDFFAHPEDCIERLESSISGIRLDELEYAVRDFFRVNEARLYGIGPEDIIYAVKEAVK
ncbi:MAG: lipoate--protein ligase family protein [Candidatus Altiarchaeota archaeon]|nr:lipoate--protein ligase family protein [Candidatus Altiarchaeota archaeon]